VARAIDDNASTRHAIGTTLVATMLALAIVEHWMLVLPLDTTALVALGHPRSRASQHTRACAACTDRSLLAIGSDEKLLRAR
jgi:hypothetical protein